MGWIGIKKGEVTSFAPPNPNKTRHEYNPIRSKRIEMEQTTFHWSNYTRPTPKNLLIFSRLIQGILLGISTIGSANDWPVWVPITINISIVIVSQLTLFFGNIVEDMKTETATAQFPSGEEITVSHEIKP